MRIYHRLSDGNLILNFNRFIQKNRYALVYRDFERSSFQSIEYYNEW